jgi:hypothetical protein
MPQEDSVTVRVRVNDSEFRAELARLRAEIERLRMRAATGAPGGGDGAARLGAAASLGLDFSQSATIAVQASGLSQQAAALSDINAKLDAIAKGSGKAAPRAIPYHYPDPVIENMIARHAGDATSQTIQAPGTGGPVARPSAPTVVAGPYAASGRKAAARIIPNGSSVFTQPVAPSAPTGGSVPGRPIPGAAPGVLVATNGGAQFTTPKPASQSIPKPRSGGAAPSPGGKIPSAVTKPAKQFMTSATTRVLGGAVGVGLGLKYVQSVNDTRNQYIRESLEKGEIPDPQEMNRRILSDVGDQLIEANTWLKRGLHTWLVGTPVALRMGLVRALNWMGSQFGPGGQIPENEEDLALTEYYFETQDYFGVNDEAYKKIHNAQKEWSRKRKKAGDEAVKEAKRLSEQVADRLMNLGMTGLNRGQLESIAQKWIVKDMEQKIVRDFESATPYPTERDVNPMKKATKPPSYESQYKAGVK